MCWTGLKLKLSEDIDVVDNLVISVKHMFETILSALGEHDSVSKWCQQIKRLALTHANTLLSLLQSPDAQINLQIGVRLLSIGWLSSFYWYPVKQLFMTWINYSWENSFWKLAFYLRNSTALSPTSWHPTNRQVRAEYRRNVITWGGGGCGLLSLLH